MMMIITLVAFAIGLSSMLVVSVGTFAALAVSLPPSIPSRCLGVALILCLLALGLINGVDQGRKFKASRPELYDGSKKS